jgi:hypothetical protein
MRRQQACVGPSDGVDIMGILDAVKRRQHDAAVHEPRAIMWYVRTREKATVPPRRSGPAGRPWAQAGTSGWLKKVERITKATLRPNPSCVLNARRPSERLT